MPTAHSRQQIKREPSVEVKASWKVVEEIEFARLSKLSWDVEDPKDLLLCGAVASYDRTFDKITTKTPRCVFGVFVDSFV